MYQLSNKTKFLRNSGNGWKKNTDVASITLTRIFFDDQISDIFIKQAKDITEKYADCMYGITHMTYFLDSDDPTSDLAD